MKLIRILWNNVFTHCKFLIFLIILSTTVYAFGLVPIWINKTYIDNLQLFLTGEYSFTLLIFWLLIFYITRAVSGGVLIPLAGAKDLYYDYVVTRHVRKSQHQINNSIPLENYDSKEVYDLMERSGQALTSGALRSTVNAIAAFLTMSISFISILISLFILHYLFIIFAIIMVIPMFLEYFWFQKQLYVIEKNLIMTRRQQSFCIDHINGRYFFQTRISGSAPYFIDKWEKYHEKSQHIYNKIHKKKMLFGLFSGIIKSGCIVGMILTGLYLLSDNKITVGSFSVIIGVIGLLLSYIDFFINTLSQSIVRIKELKEACLYYYIPQEKTEISLSNEIGEIVLENVSFKYQSRETNALTNITKTFKKGEKVAILGVNGAGKTTLTNIIMGLYSPSSGKVLYNGINISEYDKTKWRQKTTAIFQDFQIYNLTISDNVFLANTRKEKDINMIESSLKLAGFPIDKYSIDNMIGRDFDGIELSRGEGQKIAAARSYYNNDAEIIIIDEPTAALDPIAEEQLYQTFIKNSGNKTLFIVSHRLGSVKIADRILVMDASEILEDGSHEQLLCKNGIYAKMYKQQATLYKR